MLFTATFSNRQVFNSARASASCALVMKSDRPIYLERRHTVWVFVAYWSSEDVRIVNRHILPALNGCKAGSEVKVYIS